ncbi:TlpA disulfide reductase family protein [Lacimicrobium alkaliphilum]|uniref:Thioredoxin n=1 Tax=Lacimicrobium alkaliphilum TaxID=1526571 RepID=A0ABQ1QYP2_9ALTE|nr:TlpA disulfide reductase family protein [Lacimicrobium alkaliphilum]GGD52114.1 thioredoxin [Lacimicrobium alkaliphilum]
MRQKILITLAAVLALTTGVAVSQWFSSDFVTLDGEKHRWDDYQGQWVVVNYFAEWCAPCLRELPELNHFAGMTKETDITLLGMSYDRLSEDDLAGLVQKYAIEFPVILADPAPKMPNQRPNSLPATYIIGPDGKVVRQLMGEQEADLLLEIVTRLKE